MAIESYKHFVRSELFERIVELSHFSKTFRWADLRLGVRCKDDPTVEDAIQTLINDGVLKDLGDNLLTKGDKWQ